MTTHVNIRHARQELEEILADPMPSEALIPDLTEAARNPDSLRDRPSARLMEEATNETLADAHNIPALSYTRYRDVQRYADRTIYQQPWGEKRAKLAAVALQVLLGRDEYLNLLYDYIWSICEETNWILPQREDLTIDLRTAATTMDLAEIIVALRHKMEDRIVERVRTEINRRVFTDYLENHGKRELLWWKGRNNWNGVCNGGIGVGFLLLEQDTSRLAHGLEVVLEGLQVFLDTAFAEDGGSGEGVGYWQYGLSNYIAFAEMLRLRTKGAIDLLDNGRVQTIARFAPAVMLSPGRYFPYSDCREEVALNPGLLACLAERTGVGELRGLLAEPAPLTRGVGLFHTLWRSILWWDGVRPPRPRLGDVLLPDSGVVRLVGEAASSAAVVLAAKAGHNGVSHNHNDIGTFVLHVDDETYLCDPESGVYDNYVKQGRYNVIFANSFGHSVPVIGGKLQSEGETFRGGIVRYEPGGTEKRVDMELQGAYEIPALAKVLRSFRLSATGDLVLEDTFAFTDGALPVEEAFVTWNNTMVAGRTAYIVGERHILQLTIEKPSEAAFACKVLKEESDANHKSVPLKRLSFAVAPSGKEMSARVRMKVLP